MVSKTKPKKGEQNRNKEKQMETTDATEDDAGEVDTEEIAEKKAAESNVPSIQAYSEDLGDADNENNDDEAAKTTKEGSNVPAAEQANDSNVSITYETIKGDTVIEVTERNIDEYKEPIQEPPNDTSGFLDEMEAEVIPRTDEVGENPHHAALGQGAADDRPAQRDQHPSRDEEPHHTAPAPGEGDQQPSIITCKVTRTAATQAAVVRLVLNPVGYNSIVPPSHVTSQVQPSPSLRPEQENLYRTVTRHENPQQKEKMDMTHREGKQVNVCKNTSQESVQDKNHVREVHVHAYKYKQTTHRTLHRLKTSNVGHVDESNVEKGAVMIENHYEEVENKVEAQAEQIVNITDLQRTMPHFIEDGSKPDWSKNVSSLKLTYPTAR
jgi:hypothetical protein